MNGITFGDLAWSFQMQRQTTVLKADLNRLTRELSTGLKSDLSSAISGDFGPIAGIERALQTLGAHKTATTEAALMTETAQNTLGVVQDIGRALTPTLLAVTHPNNATMLGTIAVDAREKFSAVAAALNTGVGGRTVMAGAATDGRALAGADVILAELIAASAGETTAVGVAAQVDTWFDAPGGGFETLGYLGSDTDMGPFPIGNGEDVQVSARADDPALREVLKGFALASLVAEGVLAGDVEEQAQLVERSGDRLLQADRDLTLLRARVGAVEARIQDGSVRNLAETSALGIARAEMVAADPYETANRLEATYSQLETLYTVASHLAQLKFTDFMR